MLKSLFPTLEIKGLDVGSGTWGKLLNLGPIINYSEMGSNTAPQQGATRVPEMYKDLPLGPQGDEDGKNAQEKLTERRRQRRKEDQDKVPWE